MGVPRLISSLSLPAGREGKPCAALRAKQGGGVISPHKWFVSRLPPADCAAQSFSTCGMTLLIAKIANPLIALKLAAS